MPGFCLSETVLFGRGASSGEPESPFLEDRETRRFGRPVGLVRLHRVRIGPGVVGQKNELLPQKSDRSSIPMLPGEYSNEDVARHIPPEMVHRTLSSRGEYIAVANGCRFLAGIAGYSDRNDTLVWGSSDVDNNLWDIRFIAEGCLGWGGGLGRLHMAFMLCLMAPPWDHGTMAQKGSQKIS